MNVGFHECKWQDCPSFFIGWDLDSPDVYTDWISRDLFARTRIALCPQFYSGGRQVH
jgi:hypothetical protein